jgi:hypothetical protein
MICRFHKFANAIERGHICGKAATGIFPSVEFRKRYYQRKWQSGCSHVEKYIRYHTHVDNLDATIRPFAETSHATDVIAPLSPAMMSLSNNHIIDYG